MCCVLLRPLWQTASLWIMTTSSVAVLMAPCGFLTLWTFTLSPRCRSRTSWEPTSQVWLRPGTVAWVEEGKGSLWGLELFPRPWPSGACSFYGFKLAGCCRSPWVVVALPCMAGLQSQAGCCKQAGRGHRMLWHTSVAPVPWHILCLSLVRAEDSLCTNITMLLRDAPALMGHFFKDCLAIFHRPNLLSVVFSLNFVHSLVLFSYLCPVSSALALYFSPSETG